MSENGFGSNGSTPTPEQFRRRRMVAGAIAALVLLLLIWGMVSLVGAIRGSGEDTTAASLATATSAPFSDFSERPSESSSESASGDASESAAADSTVSASAEATDSASDEASDAASAESTESADANASETATAEPTAEASESVTAEATDSATAEATESASAEATDAAVVACSTNDLKVVVTTDQQSYAAGANPAIAVTYTNTSGNPCTVGGDVESIDVNITSGSAQVYNSSQCQQTAQDESELAGGASDTVVLTWTRQLNSLGCTTPVDIKPGYYWATATVNGVASTPARIIITG